MKLFLKKHPFSIILGMVLIVSFVFLGTSVFADDSVQRNTSTNQNLIDKFKVRMGIKAEVKTSATSSIQMMRDGLKASTTQVRTEMKNRIEDMRASTTEKIKEIRDEAKEKRQEMMRNEMKRKYGRMIERFTATIVRLEKILARLESRITKIKAEGGNTTVSDTFVVKTHTNLADARTNLVNLSLLASTTIDAMVQASTTPGFSASTTVIQARKISNDITLHIREAQKSMIQATSNLKPGQAKIEAGTNATTTATTTTSN